MDDAIPVGIFYRDDADPCLEDLLEPARHFSAHTKLAAIERELDRFSVTGPGGGVRSGGVGVPAPSAAVD
jgi:hypothetical protein